MLEQVCDHANQATLCLQEVKGRDELLKLRAKLQLSMIGCIGVQTARFDTFLSWPAKCDQPQRHTMLL